MLRKQFITAHSYDLILPDSKREGGYGVEKQLINDSRRVAGSGINDNGRFFDSVFNL